MLCPRQSAEIALSDDDVSMLLREFERRASHARAQRRRCSRGVSSRQVRNGIDSMYLHTRLLFGIGTVTLARSWSASGAARVHSRRCRA